jgi:hypothetical protein
LYVYDFSLSQITVFFQLISESPCIQNEVSSTFQIKWGLSKSYSSYNIFINKSVIFLREYSINCGFLIITLYLFLKLINQSSPGMLPLNGVFSLFLVTYSATTVRTSALDRPKPYLSMHFSELASFVSCSTGIAVDSLVVNFFPLMAFKW